MQENVFEVQDTSLDDRFKNNPLVIGPPSIRWYAGAPLMTSKGFIIGTLCVFGNTPRALNADQRVALIALAKQVITLLEFKEREIQFKKQSKELENLFDLSLDLICIADSEGFFKYLNPAWSLVLGYSEEELKAHPLSYFIHKDDVPQTLEEINKLKHGELTINFTHRFCTKEGSFRELNWFAYPEEKSGQFYAIARDITK
jgi:PAS domain S-box-containing protein